MSNRRMTSLDIVDTDAFLEMPQTSQNLYFHINARADDDGFMAGIKRIMKILGSSEDDLKVLISKKFIIRFEDGVCVVKHWRIANTIKNDRYKPTKYINHKKSLYIKQNGAYTQNPDDKSLPVPEGHFVVDKLFVSTSDPVRLPKLNKIKLNKNNNKQKTTKKNENDLFFEELKIFNEKGEVGKLMIEVKDKLRTNVYQGKKGKYKVWFVNSDISEKGKLTKQAKDQISEFYEYFKDTYQKQKTFNYYQRLSRWLRQSKEYGKHQDKNNFNNYNSRNSDLQRAENKRIQERQEIESVELTKEENDRREFLRNQSKQLSETFKK